MGLFARAFRRALSIGTPSANPLAPPPSSRQINLILTESARLPGSAYKHVLRTWVKHGEGFDDLNLVSAISWIGRSAAAKPKDLRDTFARGPFGRALETLLARLDERLPHLPARELATVMHAASSLPSARAHAIVLSGADLIGREPASLSFTPQGLCLVSVACARLGVAHKKMLGVVSSSACSQLKLNPLSFKPQDVSNLTWAFATLHEHDVVLFEWIAQAASTTLEHADTNPQVLANTAWAFARAGVHSHPLFESIARITRSRGLGEFKTFELAMLVWAFVKVKHENAPLLEAASSSLAAGVHLLPPQSVSNVAWAYAKAGVRADELLGAIAARIPAQLEGYSPQALGNIAWSFCIFGEFPLPLLHNLASLISQHSVSVDTPIAYLQQIVQIDNALRLDAPSLSVRIAPELVTLARRASEEFHRTASRGLHLVDHQSSRLHMEVSRCLTSLGVRHVNEFTDASCGYFIDIALPERKLAIEVSGIRGDASHFRASSQAMKCRHLRACGWRVEILSYEDWEAISLPARARLLAEFVRDESDSQRGLGLDSQMSEVERVT